MSDMFNDLVARKTQQQQTRIQTAQSVGQTLDIVQEQLQMEQAQYDQLDDDGVAAAPLTEVEKQRLAPGIETTGMSDKHATKVKTRTLKNLKKGRSEVGQMATSQTIPLMRSMRRNAKALREEREKEVTDISALANLVIPADIFDVALTKEHSHFDVKKALLIREQLRKIADFKENNPNAYTMLDFDVYTKLELLLDEKDAYETTLKTVLAANGLTETGEKATDQEIHDAREKYYIIKDSYRETMESHDANLAALVTAEKAKRSKALFDPKLELDRKTEMRAKLTEKWDGELRDGDGNWIDMPLDFLSSEYYSRVVFRMDPDDEQASYKMMQSAICAYRLTCTNVSGKERDALFKKIRSEVAPTYNEVRKKLPEFIARIEKANFDDLLAMAPEILEFELPLQHLSDIVKRCSDSKGLTLEASLDMSKEELERISHYKTLLASVKKRILLMNAIRAGKAGIPINLANLDSNLSRVAEHLADKNGDIDPAGLAQYLQRDLKSNLETFSGIVTAEHKKQTKIHEEKKAEYEHFASLEGKMAQEGATTSAQIGLYSAQTFDSNLKAYQESFMTKRLVDKDMSHLWELFQRSGLRLNDKDLGPEQLTESSFKRMIRELLGGVGESLDLKSDDLELTVNEGDFELQQLETLLEKPDEEHIMEFLQPLLTFDPMTYFGRIDKDVLENMERRFEVVQKSIAESHPVLCLKQFAEKFLLHGYLSKEATQIVDTAVLRFEAFQRHFSSLNMPFPIGTTETLEKDLPGMKNCIDSVGRAPLFVNISQKVTDTFLSDHPLVTYTLEEEKELNRLGFEKMHFLGQIRETGKPTQYPVSKEEISKIVATDESFIKELVEKVSSFSFINKDGRARIFSTSDARDFLAYGEEDLHYYAEISRNAYLLLAAEKQNRDAVLAILGKNAEETLFACKRITALQHDIHTGMTDGPGRMISTVRMMYSGDSDGQSLESLAAMREEEILAHSKERERIMRKNATL